ncbi:tRNA (adenosine(37)-N6)-threonylcarbamoyltransferase complex dimerization subunit type 1 TsaB [Nitrosomonas sp.]|uniref:tRNA (adenosine(37)-N6)-threonylcarbamoyltransferase complex dimerization subunit type 1 TsaB n=1 Tax=Nitrosomonas sp. TaxID=42353 RepID=UPI0025EAEDE0|nr:tRNA (adenosine(37)-N6)-threonylcarbamoyltransferase complex dimerization subunit type 1 TsaB [Nitrosomonas sp.]MCC6917508.1 tRNA (adenosine(37)-N6)-threonylcarbamoyltransferase complex dimerization subunit type 1 TsaB [Nitrosomonas sp.]
MNIVAFDTSTEYCSLALWLDGRLISRDVLAGQRHSELLLPMLQTMLNEAGVTLNRIDGIAFGAGPGSFTGLRIACSVAQGLAFSQDIPVVGISTLEALAQRVDTPKVLAVLDARMGELYFAAYEKAATGWSAVHEPLLCRPETAPAVSGGGWTGCGSGFDLYQPGLSEHYNGNLQQIISGCYPHAREMVQMAVIQFDNGEGKAAEEALPVYIRNKVALKESERGR